MADETVVFEAEVRTNTHDLDETQDKLTQIEDQLATISKKGADKAAAFSFNNLNKVLEENVLTLQQMGTAADAYKNIALAAGKETPIGQEALKKAAELERQMDLTNQAVTKLNDNGRLLGASLEVGTSVIAGYTALTGAQQLLGKENEDVLKSMEKLQAAQSVLMGLQELRNALDREGVLVTTAKATAEKAATAASKAFAAGQMLVNAVMSANPIGLVVIAVGALVAGFLAFKDKIMPVIKLVLAPLIIQFELIKAGIEAVGSALGLIPSAAERAAKAQADAAYKAKVATLTAEKEKQEAVIKAEAEKRAARSDAFDFEIAKLRAAGKETFAVEQEKLNYVLESLKKQKEALIEKHRLEAELVEENSKRYEFNYRLQAHVGNDIVEKSNKRREKQMQELEQQITKTEQDITLGQITEQKKRDDAAQKAWEKRKADEEKRREEELKAQQEHFKKILDGQRQLNADIKEMNEVRAREADILKPPLMKEAEETPNAVATVIGGYNQIIEAETKAAQERERIKEFNRSALLEIERGLFSATSSLIELTSKNEAEAEEKKKKLALVDLAVNTAKAIAGAVAQAQSVPFPGNIAAIVTGISAVLANMAQAKKLLSKAGADASGISASVSGGGAASDIAQGVIVQDNVGGEITTNTDDLINGTNNRTPQIVLPIETMTSGQQRLVQLEQQSTI